MIKCVYAILKNGRRYEDINYFEKESALIKLKAIVNARKNFNKTIGSKADVNNFEVVELEKPNKAW